MYDLYREAALYAVFIKSTLLIAADTPLVFDAVLMVEVGDIKNNQR